jgi:hypothetical protein
MKVIMLDTNTAVDVNDSYGMRLIEQGKAIPFIVKGASAPKTAENKAAAKGEAKK